MESVRVVDYDVRHCRGCWACWALGRCVIEDDGFDARLRKWESADLFAICSPAYWLNPSGVTEDFIDRTLILGDGTPPVFHGKKVGLVTVAAENGFELHNELMARWLRRFGGEVAGTIDLYAAKAGDLAGDAQQTEKAAAFAQGIPSMI